MTENNQLNQFLPEIKKQEYSVEIPVEQTPAEQIPAEQIPAEQIPAEQLTLRYNRIPSGYVPHLSSHRGMALCDFATIAAVSLLALLKDAKTKLANKRRRRQ